MTYTRIKQPLLESGYLETGEQVLVEAADFAAIVEIVEVDEAYIATWIPVFTVWGSAPNVNTFVVKPADRGE